jgi:hypothetical protein
LQHSLFEFLKQHDFLLSHFMQIFAYSGDLLQVVYEDLAKAREGIVLASDLHLLYEITPTYVDLEPDWSVYYKCFMELSSIDQVCES